MVKHRGFAALTAGQHGLITAAQARDLGFGPNAIARRVRSGEWERVLPTVYRLSSSRVTPRQAMLAATLWGGAGAVLSHASAGVLWGISGLRAEQAELWVPPTRRVRSGQVVVHRGDVQPRERRMVDGIPVTSVARTLVDLAARFDDESLDAAIDDVLSRGLTTIGALGRAASLASDAKRPGAARFGRLLENFGHGRAAESRLETRVRRLLHEAGLSAVRQHEVVLNGRRYRLDFAWPDLGVAVECDGFSAHGGRIAFERDRRRWADLTAAGVLVVPVTWRQATQHPTEFLERVRAALARRGRSAVGQPAGVVSGT
jgi:very-short-patch-repair endonuclease